MKWHQDERGSFLEVFRLAGAGQVSYLEIKPNQTRGNHYHKRKREVFVVVEGSATLRIRTLETHQKRTFELDASEPKGVSVVPKDIHNITAGPNGAKVLLWCNEHYDEKDPDTFPEEL